MEVMMADNLFRLEIITPERIFYEGEADMLEISTLYGDIGIYAGHIPLTTILVPGVAKIHNQGVVKKAAIHSGFMEIVEGKVVVLAEIAEWPEEIDLDRANEAKLRAERRIKEHNGDMKRAEIALRKSIARIETLK